MPDFLDLAAIEAAELHAILDHAVRRRDSRDRAAPRGMADSDAPLAGRVLAMVFASPSTRTRLSFEVAMRQMGGHSVSMSFADSQLGRGESMADTARMISCHADIVVVRTGCHSDIVAFADASVVPVINGLTDHGHPTQILSSLMSLRQRGIDLSAAHLAWVGDGNNVCASFVGASAAFGYRLTVGTPVGHGPAGAVVSEARARGGQVEVMHDAGEAVAGADVVITDTYFSMGEARGDERLREFLPFQVNEALMEKASAGALFTHCLPAWRGEEVTAGVIDGPSSIVLDEAENKVYLVKAVLAWCLGLM